MWRRCGKDQLFKGKGILNCKSVGIVVEVNKDRFPLLFPAKDLFSPLCQFSIRIVRTIEGFTSVKAKVNES